MDSQVVENESQQAVAAIVEPVQPEQVSSASADLMPTRYFATTTAAVSR